MTVRSREGGGGAKKSTKHPKSSTRDVKNGGDLDGGKKKLDKITLVQ